LFAFVSAKVGKEAALIAAVPFHNSRMSVRAVALCCLAVAATLATMLSSHGDGLFVAQAFVKSSKAKQQIFFVHAGNKRLTAISCCAIVSAAKNNPDADVIVHMQNISAAWPDRSKCFGRLSNVKTMGFSAEQVFAGTKLSGWYQHTMANGNIKAVIGGHYTQNVANALRIAFLYKEGGMYLDTDIITLGSYVGLPPNIVGKQGNGACSLNNAAMSMEPGHPFIKAYIEEFVEHFDNNNWGWNGPERISAVCKSHGCGGQARRGPGSNDGSDSNGAAVVTNNLPNNWKAEALPSTICGGMQPVHEETFAPFRFYQTPPWLATEVGHDEWSRTMAEWRAPSEYGPARVLGFHLFNTGLKGSGLMGRLFRETGTQSSGRTKKMRIEYLLEGQCGAGWREA
jgi:hypothetical protein